MKQVTMSIKFLNVLMPHKSIFLIVFIYLLGCKPYDPMQDHLTEMKEQLSSINKMLESAPLENMIVFSKPGASYVKFRYKPENKKVFIGNLYIAVAQEGYDLTSKNYSLSHDEILLFCSSKVKHRYILATNFKGGIINLEIFAGNNKPILGQTICSTP